MLILTLSSMAMVAVVVGMVWFGSELAVAAAVAAVFLPIGTFAMWIAFGDACSVSLLMDRKTADVMAVLVWSVIQVVLDCVALVALIGWLVLY